MTSKNRLLTMCMIQRGNEVLLLKRPSEKDFPGYIAPGGKLEFPESLMESAIGARGDRFVR